VFEIYRVMRRLVGAARANEVASALRRSRLVLLDESLALDAAEISIRHGLAMADSIIYATALLHGATLITGDHHFEGLPSVVIVD